MQTPQITDNFDLALRDATALMDIQQVYALVDADTRLHCLPIVRQTLKIEDDHVCEIPVGDKAKNLETVQQIWNFLIEHGATRKSILINIGGGMLTDIGGFAASTFKRGIPFVNVPTTVLGAVDAATGGKTGFNYHGLKNEIGLFKDSKVTIIYPELFKTLPPKEFLSGFAEMLKHGLISSPLEFCNLLEYDLNTLDLERLSSLIHRSCIIKHYLVEQDPEETGMRKALNFGHTIGHALEEAGMAWDMPLLHGYAVMYGMIAELYLSVKRFGFSKETLQQMVSIMIEFYGKIGYECKDYDKIIDFMVHDKKNSSPDAINFTLLKAIGNVQINQVCTRDEIKEALGYLFTL